jgi:hypothetical protein
LPPESGYIEIFVDDLTTALELGATVLSLLKTYPAVVIANKEE